MAIKPIDLPAAAGLEFGKGDVRHFSEDDAMDVPGLQNPSRHLAERDNLLAKTLNEVVEVVNNKEQFVPLTVPRTSVPPSTEEIIGNFRIPPGFEARVLNAVVASTPASSNITVNVYYATGYGNTSGASVATTSGEQFYNDGELIISLKNTGSTSLDCMASITLTMRPISDPSSLLVGSVIQGQEGKPGQKGEKGLKGDPGIGGVGSPGMVWRDAWSNGATYTAPNDVVSFELYGTLTSSYIARVTHVASPANQPPNTGFWSPVAVGSSGSTTVVVNSFTSGSLPTYSASVVIGTLVPDGDYVGGATLGDYTGGGSAFGTTTQAFNQYYVESPTSASSPKGLAMLSAVKRAVFKGSVKVFLPQIAPEGAKINWSTDNVRCLVTVDGTGTAPLDVVNLARVRTFSVSQFNVSVLDPNPLQTTITLMGMQPIA